MEVNKHSKHSKYLRPIFYILIVLLSVYVPRSLGWTQSMEMFVYDQLIRLRPLEPTDERIVIVGLTDKDIEQIGQVPLDDSTLAKLINNIRKNDPKVIGLDLHRNVPIGKGQQALKSTIKSTPNIVGIEKTSQGSFDFPAIPANSEIAKNGMSSASDLIVDGNDIVRRGYLYVRKNDKPLPSFALKIALEYLKDKGINPSSSDDLKLDKVIFSSLENNREFYNLKDIDDIQILINFRSSKIPFRTISFSEILNNDFDPNLIKDKIVMIGAFSPTLGDNFFTPQINKTINHKDEVFGVEIHAHQTSQIISAVLDNRKTIKLIPSIIESTWILFWIITPSFILFKTINIETKISQFYLKYIIFVVSTVIIILLTGYLLLVAGYWIPISNPIIAVIASAFLGYNYFEIIREKQSALSLTTQLNQAKEDLVKAQNELITKEKLKAYKILSIKMAHEIRNYLYAISVINNNCKSKLKELDLLLEDNSFLFEDIYENADESPQYTAKYISKKLISTEENIQTICLIIESILAETTSKIEKPLPININKLLNKILKESNWAASHSIDDNLSIKIETNFYSNLSNINISMLDLERVLMNLLCNARDSLYQKQLTNFEYTPWISISTSQQVSTINITIKDNGIGIHEDNFDKIFTPFWSTKKSTGGTGVGLFFSKQKIEKYNGTIKVESIEGEWTEFTITFPQSTT